MGNWKERTQILVGEQGLEKLSKSTVMVVGLGGVGAYAAEMICRAGVGNMIILDSDTVNESNKNRQLVALDSTIGKLKTDVLAARLKDINPQLNLTVIDKYLEEDNRPQVTLDVDYENGMGVSVGRIREDSIYDYKFVGLSHNTVRGAAGGAVLCAELLKAQGYITKK